MPYDDKEAVRTLANARAAKFPDEYRAKRLSAAEQLLKAAIDAAVQAGWKASKDRQGDDIIEARPGVSGVVWIKASDEGIHVGHTFFGGQHQSLGVAALEFDPAGDEWRGKEEDTDRIPVPGERKDRRKDALVVVAELLAKALDPKRH
jgi:hypothetical protein